MGGGEGEGERLRLQVARVGGGGDGVVVVAVVGEVVDGLRDGLRDGDGVGVWSVQRLVVPEQRGRGHCALGALRPAVEIGNPLPEDP